MSTIFTTKKKHQFQFVHSTTTITGHHTATNHSSMQFPFIQSSSRYVTTVPTNCPVLPFKRSRTTKRRKKIRESKTGYYSLQFTVFALIPLLLQLLLFFFHLKKFINSTQFMWMCAAMPFITFSPRLCGCARVQHKHNKLQLIYPVAIQCWYKRVSASERVLAPDCLL